MKTCTVALCALLVSGCAASPLAPSPQTTAPVSATYVVIGDSVAKLGPWSQVQAAVGGTFLNAGVGSTMLATDWQPGGSAYVNMQTIVGSQQVTAFLCHLGANDVAILQPSSVQFLSELQTLVSSLQTTYHAPVYLADVGQVWTYGDRTQADGNVVAAIHQAWTAMADVRPGPEMQDLTPDDGVHFTSPMNQGIIAQRWTAILK